MWIRKRDVRKKNHNTWLFVLDQSTADVTEFTNAWTKTREGSTGGIYLFFANYKFSLECSSFKSVEKEIRVS